MRVSERSSHSKLKTVITKTPLNKKRSNFVVGNEEVTSFVDLPVHKLTEHYDKNLDHSANNL